MDIITKLQSHLPEHIRRTEIETTKGLLFLPNDNVRHGPKYLININYPLKEVEIDWDMVTPFFNGGCEKSCREFFAACNGFSLSYRWSTPGILTHNPYDGAPLSEFNIALDLGGQSYGSYPRFAPSIGYFISEIRIGGDDREICDIVTPEGNIIYGEFRKNGEVLGEFKSFEDWIDYRGPQAVLEIEKDLKKFGN